MNELMTFQNEDFGEIRSVMIEGEPWFVGKDVAQILGYRNGSRDINRHVDEDDRQVIQNYQNGTLEIPNRGMTFINESGVYALIFGSKLQSAKQFKRWVTSEVLPSIRKTGSYALPAELAEVLPAISEALLEIRDGLEERVSEMEESLAKRIDLIETKLMLPPAPITYLDCMGLPSNSRKATEYVHSLVAEILEVGAYPSEKKVFSILYGIMRRNMGVDVEKFMDEYRRMYPDEEDVSAWYIVKNSTRLFNTFVRTAEDMLKYLKEHPLEGFPSAEDYNDARRRIPFIAYKTASGTLPVFYKRIYKYMEQTLGVNWGDYGGKKNRRRALNEFPELQNKFCQAVNALAIV